MLGRGHDADYSAPVGRAARQRHRASPAKRRRTTRPNKALTKITADYAGSEEAYIAEYYLAAKTSRTGKLDDARKKYQDVIDHADANHASLGETGAGAGRSGAESHADAAALLKELMDHPTDLVSKEQATIDTAQAIAPSQPDEARKLLHPLANTPSDISSIAGVALSEPARQK